MSNSGPCFLFETTRSDYLGDSVETEISKQPSADLCGTQQEGGGLEREAPGKEFIKE